MPAKVKPSPLEREPVEASTEEPVAPDPEHDQLEVAPDPEPAIPTPTAFRMAWYPAAVLTAEGKQIYLAKVYLTVQGLYVFTAPNSPPAYYTAVDYDKTTKPNSNYAATRKRVAIHTTDGRVVTVTPTGGCGCVNRPLNNWRPDWAQRIEAWS